MVIDSNAARYNTHAGEDLTYQASTVVVISMIYLHDAFFFNCLSLSANGKMTSCSRMKKVAFRKDL